jgi:hypothetical protein
MKNIKLLVAVVAILSSGLASAQSVPLETLYAT